MARKKYQPIITTVSSLLKWHLRNVEQIIIEEDGEGYYYAHIYYTDGTGGTVIVTPEGAEFLIDHYNAEIGF